MTDRERRGLRVVLEAPARESGCGGAAGAALLRALERAVESQAAPADAPAGAALALDAAGLARARDAGLAVRVALLAGLSIDFPGGLADATHALVADPAIAAYVARPGLVVASVGPLVAAADAETAPVPGAASADAPAATGAGSPGEAGEPTPASNSAEARAALRRALGLADGARVVAVSAHEAREAGLRALLVQLELCRFPPAVWLDVGDDAETARRVRAALPGHALDAWIVGAGSSAAALAAADLALARAAGPFAVEALAAGAPVLALPRDEGRAERAALSALLALAQPRPSSTLATLAVALDAALAEDGPERARAALAARDLPGSAARAVAYAAEALAAIPGPRRSASVGVPSGFERVSWRDDAASRAGPAGADVAGAPAAAGAGARADEHPPPEIPPRGHAAATAARPGAGERPPAYGDADLDARVEAELAALKARLGAG